MNRFLKIAAVVAPFAPIAAFAQINNIGYQITTGPGVSQILGTISSIFAVIIPLLITAAVIYVIYGVIKYATASDDDKQAEGRKVIISGVVALFVIVSIWGLVAILNRTFDVGQGGQNVGGCQPVWNPNANGGQGDFVPPPQC